MALESLNPATNYLISGVSSHRPRRWEWRCLLLQGDVGGSRCRLDSMSLACPFQLRTCYGCMDSSTACWVCRMSTELPGGLKAAEHVGCCSAAGVSLWKVTLRKRCSEAMAGPAHLWFLFLQGCCRLESTAFPSSSCCQV